MPAPLISDNFRYEWRTTSPDPCEICDAYEGFYDEIPFVPHDFCMCEFIAYDLRCERELDFQVEHIRSVYNDPHPHEEDHLFDARGPDESSPGEYGEWPPLNEGEHTFRIILECCSGDVVATEITIHMMEADREADWGFIDAFNTVIEETIVDLWKRCPNTPQDI